MERLTTKRDNKLESSHYSEIQKRGTRGVKRKIHYANDHESEIMVKVETEFAEGPGKFNEQDQVWLMDEDDHNSSRDDLSDREISHHDSSKYEKEESSKILKPRRIRERGVSIIKMDFKCPLCTVRFASQLALDCHRRKIHEGINLFFLFYKSLSPLWHCITGKFVNLQNLRIFPKND